eukprot:2652720-Alexandrium_andersonii.AAC.1
MADSPHVLYPLLHTHPRSLTDLLSPHANPSFPVPPCFLCWSHLPVAGLGAKQSFRSAFWPDLAFPLHEDPAWAGPHTHHTTHNECQFRALQFRRSSTAKSLRPKPTCRRGANAPWLG